MKIRKKQKKLSLENSVDKKVLIMFPEGFRKGIINKTTNPSYPYSFNFKKMNI